MTHAELADKIAAEQRALAEKHISQWEKMKMDFEKEMIKTGDTPEFKAQRDDRIVAFTIQMGQENRDLEATQILEFQRVTQAIDSPSRLEANSSRQIHEDNLHDRQREQQALMQKKEVREEYKAHSKDIANAERHEQYNRNSIPNDKATDQAAEIPKKVEQISLETDHEMRRRLLSERILKNIESRKKENDNGR